MVGAMRSPEVRNTGKQQMTPKDKSTGPKPAYASRGSRDSRKSDGDAPKRDSKPAGKASDKTFSRSSAVASASGEATKPERISKLLARAGIASRRDIERMIMEGRVSLNGKVLETPVVNATFADKIEVDGEPIRGVERTRLWLYHKPAGLVTTNADPEGRPTVFDNLPEELPRVVSIGRLDINTEGLLLLTNDGGLARVLELPTTGWLRRYRVRAYGEVEQADLDKLKDGIAVDGVLYGAIEATLDRKQGHNVWITMGLREGKNREIKNVLGELGLEVNRLIRISYGPFQLGDIAERKALEVRGRMLRDQLGPRLIEDAKANFDAPLFSDGAAEEKTEAKEKRPWGAREKGSDFREEGRARLDTRKSSSDRGERKSAPKSFGGGKSAGRDEDRGYGDKPKSRPAATRARTANVWMAPGARPVAEKTAREEGAEARKPARRDGAPQSKRYGRDKDGLPTRSRGKFDPDSKGKSDFRRDDGPRVVVSRTRDEEGEWIRADSPAKPDRKDGGGFGDKRSFGGRSDRPERNDRGPRDDRGQRGDRGPREDRGPRSDRSDRPARAERSGEGRPARGDRPFGDKPFGDKPRGAKPFGDKPRGKPAGGRAFGDKPGGGKPSGGKPSGGRSFGDKPGGDRPRGDRPGGGKPQGGRGPFKGRR